MRDSYKNRHGQGPSLWDDPVAGPSAVDAPTAMRVSTVRLLTATVLGGALFLAAPAHAQTPAPSTVSYQGVLTDAAGTPVPDGPQTLSLRLFEAATGGTAVYAETHTAPTTGGVFAVEIGGGTPTSGTWAGVHFDRSYWLETAVGTTTLTPRTRLSASPYARSLTPGARIGAPASGSALTAAGLIESTAGGIRYPDGTTQTSAASAFTLPYTASVSNTNYLLNLTNTSTSGEGIQAVTAGAIAIRGESAAGTGSGVVGQATSTTGVSYGGFFRSASTSGQAVFAQATASSGTTYGVYGQSLSATGRGVYGTAGSYGVHGVATGTGVPTFGVRGESVAPNGYGVRGDNEATTGQAYGVYGVTASTSGVGVYGTAAAVTGSTDGVVGQVSSTSGTGVRGNALATSGGTYGGYFRSYSSAGTGVYGWASSTSGENYGVSGLAAGSTGRGVYGGASGTAGIGVQGRASSPVGTTYGAYFESASTLGYGVVGEAEASSGTTYGVYGSSSSPAGVGVYAVNFGGGLAARVAGASRFDASMEFFEGNGSDLRIRLDVDEGADAPSIKLLRAGATVLELDADHNGDSRVITQELEITGGADLAELFDVSTASAPGAGTTTPAPGMVVAIDPAQPGRLAVAATPYDPLVAGVMSGAGGVEAGMIMGQRGSVADGAHAVALVGRVYVLADASHGAIRPGDFLTTSATPGHAMVAPDAERRQGAVLGKAMTALESGRGLVLVLVSLQ